MELALVVRRRALAAIRRVLAAAQAAERLLDPPRVTIERTPTVPEYLQCRLATHDAWCARQLELLANLQAKIAEQAPIMAVIEAERAAQEMEWN